MRVGEKRDQRQVRKRIETNKKKSFYRFLAILFLIASAIADVASGHRTSWRNETISDFFLFPILSLSLYM